MGYDQHQQPNSSGTLVAVVGVGLVLAILGIIVVAATGLFWVRASTIERARAVEQRTITELHRAASEQQRATAMAQSEPSRAASSSDPKLDFQLTLDREGNNCVDGEQIGHDELRTRLAKLKDETSNALSVRIDADPECPTKHLIAVLDVCDELGDIDYRIVSSNGTHVRITATVASYEVAAEWDHFDDGTFSTYDNLTLKVMTPEAHAGTTLSITVPSTTLPEDSALRTPGTRLTFKLQGSDLSAAKLSWGVIENSKVVQ